MYAQKHIMLVCSLLYIFCYGEAGERKLGLRWLPAKSKSGNFKISAPTFDDIVLENLKN